MNEMFILDWKRYKKTNWSWKCIFNLLKSPVMIYTLAGRCSVTNHFTSYLWGGVQKYLGHRMGCEVGWKYIDPGIILSHPYGITVNGEAKIGKDCTLFKGCTIGSIRDGKKAGVPTVGDRVVVCCNAMVCGNITIGNDVLIAAGAYVNFSVPDNCVVIGNPGVIHHKKNPTRDYL